MGLSRKRTLPVVFFCSLGWVCAGEVIGQTADADIDGAAPATPAATSVFADTATPDDAAAQNVGMDATGKIDLHVKDLEVTKVLQLLSIQSSRNIVSTKNVVGNISADLYGVDFYEALDAVLHANGFGYREQGNMIHVYTQQELDEINAASKVQARAVIRLNYLSAADASAFVSPMLSGSGSITVSADAPQSLQTSVSDAGVNSFAHADTLVVRDFEENIEAIREILKELDIRPKQVLVEATILQARLTEANAFGVDFAIFTDLNLENFTTPLGAVNELLTGSAIENGANSGTAITSTPGNTLSGPSSIKLGIVGSDAAVFVRALQSVTDTNVLSNPKVTILNRQRADLHIGEKLGYLSTTTTETSSTQTVEFLEVGTRLMVRPFVAEDNFVRVELSPSVSAGDTSRVVNGQVIPQTSESQLTTNIIVKSGQSIVLGGLFKEDTSRSRNQTPFLGDVPILGEAFKGRDDTVTRSEVIFLVKPTIMRDETLAKISNDALSDATAQAMAARDGLLPWSRTKLLNGHLRDARAALDSGDEKKALWSANMALSLDPTMVEAIRMREAITGKKVYRSTNSVLNDAVDRYIGESMPVDEEPAADVSDATEPAAEESEQSADAAPVAEEPAADAMIDEAIEVAASETPAEPVESIETATTEPALDTTAEAVQTVEPTTDESYFVGEPEAATAEVPTGEEQLK